MSQLFGVSWIKSDLRLQGNAELIGIVEELRARAKGLVLSDDIIGRLKSCIEIGNTEADSSLMKIVEGVVDRPKLNTNRVEQFECLWEFAKRLEKDHRTRDELLGMANSKTMKYNNTIIAGIVYNRLKQYITSTYKTTGAYRTEDILLSKLKSMKENLNDPQVIADCQRICHITEWVLKKDKNDIAGFLSQLVEDELEALSKKIATNPQATTMEFETYVYLGTLISKLLEVSRAFSIDTPKMPAD